MTFRLDERLAPALRFHGRTVIEMGRDGAPGKNWLTTSRTFQARPYGQANHWDAIGKIDIHRWALMLQTFKRFNGAATYNGGVWDDGTIVLWSAGKTVNVGKVDTAMVALVREGMPVTGGRKPRLGDAYGNSWFLGWVIRNSGSKREPIAPVQHESLVVLNAVCCDLYGFDPAQSVTHKQLTSRKVDIPLPYDLPSSIREYRRDKIPQAGLIIEESETMADLAKLPKWEIERRAVQRMEQLFRRAWGPSKVPDHAGYVFWCQQISDAADTGDMDYVGRTVIQAIYEALKIPELEAKR